MADYKLTHSDTVIRTLDGAHIPGDPRNADRAEYDEWLAGGGMPDAADPAVLRSKSEKVDAEISGSLAISGLIDEVAKARGVNRAAVVAALKK